MYDERKFTKNQVTFSVLCPNCGAPLTGTSFGKCEYCGSIVSTGVHDWVLSNLEPFRY